MKFFGDFFKDAMEGFGGSVPWTLHTHDLMSGEVLSDILPWRISLAVFSSKGATVQRMQQYRDAGMTTVEAIKTLVERGEVS